MSLIPLGLRCVRALSTLRCNTLAHAPLLSRCASRLARALSSLPAPSAPPLPDAPLPGATVGAEDGFYALMFTCRVCETRTARRISKQGYHPGSVLVRCPGCLGLHLIADHLGYFSDDAVDAEDLLRERGEAATRSDSSVYELSRNDAAVLASRGKSVRLRDGAELDVVGFSGAAAAAAGGAPGGPPPSPASPPSTAAKT